jgi:hypothetical protein
VSVVEDECRLPGRGAQTRWGRESVRLAMLQTEGQRNRLHREEECEICASRLTSFSA